MCCMVCFLSAALSLLDRFSWAEKAVDSGVCSMFRATEDADAVLFALVTITFFESTYDVWVRWPGLLAVQETVAQRFLSAIFLFANSVPRRKDNLIGAIYLFETETRRPRVYKGDMCARMVGYCK